VRNIVLKSAAPRQPKRVADFVDIRSLESDQDWEQAIDNQVLCREEGHDEASFRVFTERQMRRYREMSAAGKGDWFGAFVGDRLVADLGLFTDGTLGRYQSVETHPDFRRRGIAGTLVYKVGEHMMDKHGIGTLVIVAENDSDAARLYRTTGFEPVEPQWGLEWWESRE
jgi:ribosomal protein S18 acetylase RimI-like enzyme